MRIVQIVPGSGGTFYCENCVRDLSLVRALRERGHDPVVVPMYLPLFADDGRTVGDTPVFFGGISTFVREKMRLPRPLAALLDAAPLLRLAARQAGRTRAHGLGRLTLSMIHGESGRHAEEIDRLAEWLNRNPPDVVQISNVLLIGLARRLRARLRAPVVCILQDEDTWLDALDAPYDRLCWEAIRERQNDVAAFVAVSDQYRTAMFERLGLTPERCRLVYAGIDPEGYQPAARPPDPPVIGYLARMSASLGLGLLVDAFLRLRKRPGLERLRLAAMGGQTGDDRRFLAGLRKKAAAAGAGAAVEFRTEFDRASRLEFLRSVSVVSVPVPAGEASGMFALEAWAAGVPVVEPRRGVFPELLAATGGGLLCEPGDVGALADALLRLLQDPALARRMGAAGREAVRRRFTTARMAEELLQVYEAARARGA